MAIEIFEDVNFSGTYSGQLDQDYTSLGDFWNDKISSIKIYAGDWEFFEHTNFQGRSFRLSPGEYPNFHNEVNDTISSFKRVSGNGSSGLSDGVVKRVLDLTNEERSRAGLSPLAFNPQLTAAAQKHSQSMAMQDFFDHRNMVGRVVAEGYRYSRIGENIAAGNSTPEDTVAGWMNSQGHRSESRVSRTWSRLLFPTR